MPLGNDQGVLFKAIEGVGKLEREIKGDKATGKLGNPSQQISISIEWDERSTTGNVLSPRYLCHNPFSTFNGEQG